MNPGWCCCSPPFVNRQVHLPLEAQVYGRVLLRRFPFLGVQNLQLQRSTFPWRTLSVPLITSFLHITPTVLLGRIGTVTLGL